MDITSISAESHHLSSIASRAETRYFRKVGVTCRLLYDHQQVDYDDNLSAHESHLQLPAAIWEFVLADIATEAKLESRKPPLLPALDAATSSSRFQVDNLLLNVSFSLIWYSSNLERQSSKRAWSASEKTFFTLRVKLWTAWFQWLLVLLSKAGMIMGSITLRFWVIRVLIWSLFHRNNARSATCNK